MNRGGGERGGVRVEATAVLAMRRAKVVKTPLRGGWAVASPVAAFGVASSGAASFRGGAARAAWAMRDDSNE